MLLNYFAKFVVAMVCCFYHQELRKRAAVAKEKKKQKPFQNGGAPKSAEGANNKKCIEMTSFSKYGGTIEASSGKDSHQIQQPILNGGNKEVGRQILIHGNIQGRRYINRLFQRCRDCLSGAQEYHKSVKMYTKSMFEVRLGSLG